MSEESQEFDREFMKKAREIIKERTEWQREKIKLKSKKDLNETESKKVKMR